MRASRRVVGAARVGRLGVTPLALATLFAACSAAPPEGEDPAIAVPLEIRFTLDEEAFTAPPALQTIVPFDIVSADMDLDGDADLLVNWHNLAPLELFENRDGVFALVNGPGVDRSGLYENEGVVSLYAPAEETLARARAAGAPGVYVWHDPSPREDWHIYVAPGDAPATLQLRANSPLTPRLDERFIRRRDEFSAALEIDATLHFRVGVEFVATQLAVSASLPVFAGAELTPVGAEVSLWKDDPHGIAWVNVRGTSEPEIFISRGGLEGTLLPPHDAKRDRFFEYAGGDPLYADARRAMPANYGRGRRVEWVDIDGDAANELYVGNTDTPNALLSGDGAGGYEDIAPALGLDFVAGDTFAWLDIDADGLDDLVAVEASGFTVAFNRGERTFNVVPGADIGLSFPAGSEPVVENLFVSLSLNVLDVDNDGRLDLWLSGHGEQRAQALFRGVEGGFEDVTVDFGLEALGIANRIVFFDIQNDGFVDALSLGAAATWLHNQGGRRFSLETVDPAWDLRVFTHAMPLDIDGDTLVDVALVDHRRMVARNASSGAGRVLRVLPRAAGEDPVGALVTAFYADGTARTQRFGSTVVTRYSQGLAPLRFGIPDGAAIERIEVRWPGGRTESREVSESDTLIEVRR